MRSLKPALRFIGMGLWVLLAVACATRGPETPTTTPAKPEAKPKPGAPVPVGPAQEAPYRDPDFQAVADQRYARYAADSARQVAEITRMLSRDATQARHYAERGYFQAQLGKRAEAKTDLEQAIALAPQDRYVRWRYGWALFALDNPRQAIAQWQIARRLHGGRPFWLPSTLAVAYWTAGDRALAYDWMTQALASHPDFWATAAAAERSIRNWKTKESAQMRALLAAWRQQAATR